MFHLADVVLASDGQDTLGDAVPELHRIAVEVAGRPSTGQSRFDHHSWPWRGSEELADVDSYHDGRLAAAAAATAAMPSLMPVANRCYLDMK